jgi:hypothetical protein
MTSKHVISGYTFAAFCTALAVMGLSSDSEAARRCIWEGTAPICAGTCGTTPGYGREIGRAAKWQEAVSLVNALGISLVGEGFGGDCHDGSKALCCE